MPFVGERLGRCLLDCADESWPQALLYVAHVALAGLLQLADGAARVVGEDPFVTGGGLLSVEPLRALVRKKVQQILLDRAADQVADIAHVASC